MLSFRQFSLLLFLAFIVIASYPAYAALRYQQDLTLTTWKSQEEIEKMVQEFCNAAKEDTDVKVISVKYRKRKMGKNNIAYEAIIKCHVSEIDLSLMGVQGKIFQKKYLPMHDEECSQNIEGS